MDHDARIAGAGITTVLDAIAIGAVRNNVVRDELTGVEYDWGQRNAVRLDPYLNPAHVFTVHRHAGVPAGGGTPDAYPGG